MRRMDVSLEARWLVERSAAAGYVVIIILTSFGSQGVMWSYDSAFLPNPRGQYIMLLTEAYSFSDGPLYWWWRQKQRQKKKLAQMVRKHNE